MESGHSCAEFGVLSIPSASSVENESFVWLVRSRRRVLISVWDWFFTRCHEHGESCIQYFNLSSSFCVTFLSRRKWHLHSVDVAWPHNKKVAYQGKCTSSIVSFQGNPGWQNIIHLSFAQNSWNLKHAFFSQGEGKFEKVCHVVSGCCLVGTFGGDGKGEATDFFVSVKVNYCNHCLNWAWGNQMELAE